MNNRCEHILIMRLSAMGDVAMTVPAIAQLRREYPNLKISILTRPFFEPFFRDIPDLHFIAPELKGRHRGILGVLRLFNELRGTDIDTVADLHDVLRTKILRILMRICGRRVAKIDKGRWEKKLLTRKFRKFKKQLTPTTERYREVFEHLSIPISPLLPPSGRSKRPVPEFIAQSSGEKTGIWIGFAPFAQHKGKIYPNRLSDKLIGMLQERYDKVFIFGGGSYERDFAECMQQRHSGVISVIGKMSLAHESDLMANLDCMITMDSASMHMASLEGTPVVSVWGATHPFAGFYGFGQDPNNAIQLDLPCRPCSVYGNKRCIFKDYRCLTGIEPETILERVEKVVKK